MARLDLIRNPLLFRGRMLIIMRNQEKPDTEANRQQLDNAREHSRPSTSSRLKRMAEEGKPLWHYTKRFQKRAGGTGE